jgi:hypothetical protein
MPLGKKNFIVNPINSVNTNVYSFKNGSPIVKFTLPAVDMLLDTQDMTLDGQVVYLNAAGVILSLNGDNASYSENTTNMNPITATNYSPFGGAQNLLQKIVIESKKSKVELVNNPNYGIGASLNEMNKFNEDEYKRVPLCTNLSLGGNADFSTRRLITVSADPENGTPTSNQGQYFSMNFDVGLLKYQLLHLGNDFMGGCDISLYLANDANVLFQRFRQNDGATANANISGSSYQLKNLKLTGRYIIPTPQELKAYQSIIMYEDYTELVNNVHSSVNSVSYTPQLQFVESIINLYQRQDSTNNYTLNSNNYPQLVGLKQITQSKNGMRYPQDYKVNVTPNADDTLAQNLTFKNLGVGDTEIQLISYKALNYGKLPYHTSMSLKQSSKNMEQEYATQPNQTTGNNLYPDMSVLGCDYSFGVGLIQNYVNQDYAIETSSGVDTGDVNLPQALSTGTANQYTLVKCLSELNLKNLVTVS